MSKCKTGLMAVAGILALSACGSISTTPETDARFGESTSIIKAQQTLNPDASRNTNPVAGIDGKAAKGAMEQYRKSFGAAKEAEGRSPAISVTPSASSN